MVKLIVAEKPSAAKKIANALADGKAERYTYKKVSFYKIKHGNDEIIVTSAVGHLYTLDESTRGSWSYPTFDIVWKPIYLVKKEVQYAKDYIEFLQSLKDKVDEVIIATDYDIEGEVIGLNVVRFALGRKDASRMKFSTLTKPDLIRAYETRSKTLDWGQAFAGETRHFLDWYYGINLSRALALAYKHASKKFSVLSTGRVQGPALKLIVDLERRIQSFVPEKYWQLFVKFNDIKAEHVHGKFDDFSEVNSIYEKIKNAKVGEIIEFEKVLRNIPPVQPFDLTTLQSEAYRIFKIKPQKTLEIAQNLYLAGCISYPRTSSQKLDPKIGFKSIIQKLGEIQKYKLYADYLLKKSSLKPNNGKKDDPAHPAIYPTGLTKQFTKDEAKIYDLIVKRFFATFGDAAKRETITLKIKVHNQLFVARITHTVERGWFDLYDPYVDVKEQELPFEFKKGDIIKIDKVLLEEKETQPPKRFSPSSIIRELEKRGLGTKATRAQIIESLFQRKYVEGDKSIKPTKLGFAVVDALEKYSPLILSEELTRKFEEEMEKIRQNQSKPEDVLVEAKELLTKILNDFKNKELVIGQTLHAALEETKKNENSFGTCPKCGSKLTIRHGKYGQFIACTNYPNCNFTYNLPNNAKAIKESKKKCPFCNRNMISLRIKKNTYYVCINPDCPGNKIVNTIVDQTCPKCGSKLVVRKSAYGFMLSCSNYPKCTYVKPLDEQKIKDLISQYLK